MPVYNKLVRDLIPEVIEKTGKSFTSRILNDGEYINELNKKAQEELAEYYNAKDQKEVVEELADLLEVMHAMAQYHGTTMTEIERVREQKVMVRGGFKEKVLLIEVSDE
ncbi:putative house-cleaning noncanonical NTP pyrophosphatase (MazG superfamily) [Bacillus mesophilus]|uniref:Nucleoside triphosphate pyrophosphohydrolase n=1 Tax=Bacillus mesophilus TaxID=1808955 RepID=A0A6M0Q7M7_9BACI|nr:nucleoside triphosphate pyrophosphohydrolase [Bacillus mesophilus]MBM7660400.1 putative house-cleaning noncanonical NTP pyrophosphatase (MazG superfamily) [Bacillus mesophilus]NEY71108.1 nucleoside triphosphate pyrophosphohydrolase [Bacillus mesophilus]